jgi:hypothetical protein
MSKALTEIQKWPNKKLGESRSAEIERAAAAYSNKNYSTPIQVSSHGNTFCNGATWADSTNPAVKIMKSALETVLFGLTEDVANNSGMVDFAGLIATVKGALEKIEK